MSASLRGRWGGCLPALVIPHLDAGPIHVVTSASLTWLRTALPDAQVDERRFRPNLVIEVPGDVPVEQGWPGRSLLVGESVRLRISTATERCGMIAFAQAGLSAQPRVLRRITRSARLRFGVYADVVTPGHIRVGDAVTPLAPG